MQESARKRSMAGRRETCWEASRRAEQADRSLPVVALFVERPQLPDPHVNQHRRWRKSRQHGWRHSRL